VRKPRIFINYRREDSAGYAGRLYDSLTNEFGESHVFIDIDTIRLGSDFTEELDRALSQSDVCLAVIGPSWLSAADRGGRRLDHPDDFVRKELEGVLERDVTLIPVLVHGAEMPSTTELPSSLHRLAFKQALELSDRRWRSDVGQLVGALDEIARRRRTGTRARKKTAEPAPPRRHEDDTSEAEDALPLLEESAPPTPAPSPEQSPPVVDDRPPRPQSLTDDSAVHKRRPWGLILSFAALGLALVVAGLFSALGNSNESAAPRPPPPTTTTSTTAPNGLVLRTSFDTAEPASTRWREGAASAKTGSSSPGREEYADGGYRVTAAHSRTVWVYPPGQYGTDAGRVPGKISVDATVRFPEVFVVGGGVWCDFGPTYFYASINIGGSWGVWRADPNKALSATGGPTTPRAIVREHGEPNLVHLECDARDAGRVHLMLQVNGQKLTEVDDEIVAASPKWLAGLQAWVPDTTSAPEGTVIFDDFSLTRLA
jgi:hypothetical protein